MLANQNVPNEQLTLAPDYVSAAQAHFVCQQFALIQPVAELHGLAVLAISANLQPTMPLAALDSIGHTLFLNHFLVPCWTDHFN